LKDPCGERKWFWLLFLRNGDSSHIRKKGILGRKVGLNLSTRMEKS